MALSRARLGLYILGRREVFEGCYELKPAFDRLLQRPDKLMLAPGEMFPTTRALDANIEGTPMEGLEHLGQYVFEMTQAKVKAMGDGEMVLDDATPNGEDGALDEDEVMEGADEDEDVDIVWSCLRKSIYNKSGLKIPHEWYLILMEFN